MHEVRRTRRSFLGSMAALVATALVSQGRNVYAGDNAWQTVGYDSREAFQKNCKETGGSFSADGIGNTSCTWKDGSWTECDTNGKDCWHTPPPRTQPPDDPFGDPFGGSGVADDASTTPAPASGTSAPAAQGSAGVTSGKRRTKRRKRGRKSR